MANIEQEAEIEQEVKTETKTKRKKLTMSERMRIIEDFRNGIPDKYYSVNPSPRKPGEYILRKRKSPLTYDIEKPTHKRNESITDSIAENTNETTKTPSQLLTEPKKSFVGTGTALNPLAGTEFFSMQSSLNANLQRELDTLHEKFNNLDAKFRKERAARKAKNQEPNQQQAPPTQAVRRRKPAPKPQPEPEPEPQGSDSHEYEYEYVDEPPADQEEQQPHVNPFGLRTRPIIDIRDF